MPDLHHSRHGENRVKVVQDGVRQNDAYKNGGVGQTYFDTDMIKQVEVAKGRPPPLTVPMLWEASLPSPPRMLAISSRAAAAIWMRPRLCLQQPPENGRHHGGAAHRGSREPAALHLARWRCHPEL